MTNTKPGEIWGPHRIEGEPKWIARATVLSWDEMPAALEAFRAATPTGAFLERFGGRLAGRGARVVARAIYEIRSDYGRDRDAD